MRASEKAEELANRFKHKFFMEWPEVVEIKSKECALICVDEMKQFYYGINMKINMTPKSIMEYLDEIEQELKKEL